MTHDPLTTSDRRNTLAVTEDAQRIEHLARELQRNAVELEGHSQKLRGTLAALDSANEALDERTREIAEAQHTADAATARLTRLQRITAALSNTTTQDAVAESVLQEAIVALECDAGVVVTRTDSDEEEELTPLRTAGSLDRLLSSFTRVRIDGQSGPYAQVIAERTAIYLESFEGMAAHYPEFESGVSESHSAWIFLPLEIGERAVGALAFGFRTPRVFSQLDRHFADTVARYCAQALDRVRLRTTTAAALEEAFEARMMAEHADSAKTLFLRAMSHELRTPLNAIAGYTELLELGIRGEINEEQAADLGRIKRASAYLLRLINDVLTVARVEGERPLRLTVISVNPMLQEVYGLCALQAKARAVDLMVTPFAHDVFVTADAERFQQILLNLITNATKFTHKNGRIHVYGEKSKSHIHIHVKDTGVGIPPADIEKVFEAFVQLDKHLTHASLQGLGLGLSISRKLARAMDGELMVESVEGVGSTFTLMLPLGPSETPPGS